MVGQWGLIPWFAKEPKLKYPTNNARSEDNEGPSANFRSFGGPSQSRIAGRCAETVLLFSVRLPGRSISQAL